MAKSPNSKSKPQLFLCCFGFSGKLRRFKSLKPAAGHRKRPFSLTRFHSNKPPTVQPSFPAEMNRSRPDSDRFSSKSIDSTVTCESSIEGFAVAVPVATNRPGVEMIMRPDQEVKNEVVAEKTIFEGSSSPKKAAKTNQSQSGFSLTRKLESFRSGRFTQSASKNMKSDNNVQTPGISHSLSFPPSKPSRMNRVNEPLKSGLKLKSGGERRKRHRWAVGMSIVMMTLAIMVVWGRFCAILCTATWIFIVTTLTSIVEEHDTVDFLQSGSNSEGLQNKFVLLKGFLYSNRREHMLKQL